MITNIFQQDGNADICNAARVLMNHPKRIQLVHDVSVAIFPSTKVPSRPGMLQWPCTSTKSMACTWISCVPYVHRLEYARSIRVNVTGRITWQLCTLMVSRCTLMVSRSLRLQQQPQHHQVNRRLPGRKRSLSANRRNHGGSEHDVDAGTTVRCATCTHATTRTLSRTTSIRSIQRSSTEQAKKAVRRVLQGHKDKFGHW